MNIARRLVSKKKKRFQEDGFDLDLTYVTPRIIAMGFPSTDVEGLYRNKMSDVQKLFETKHANHYKIYNLCSERAYESSHFHGRVERFPFDDHNAPPFEIMLPFCKSVDEWLTAHPKNIVVVHCKAGKGRTGTMICSYLIYNHEQPNAEESLNFYATSRTKDKKGVTIPSQIRYVHYFDTAFKNGNKPPFDRAVYIDKIILSPPPKGIGLMHYKILDRNGNDLVSLKESGVGQKEKKQNIVFTCPRKPLADDLKFMFYEKPSLFKKKKEKDILHFWINTNFINPEIDYVVLQQPQIDRAHKDKKNKIFPKDFKIEIFFSPAEKQQSMERNFDLPNLEYSSVDDASPDITSDRDTDDEEEHDLIIDEIQKEYENQKK